MTTREAKWVIGVSVVLAALVWGVLSAQLRGVEASVGAAIDRAVQGAQRR